MKNYYLIPMFLLISFGVYAQNTQDYYVVEKQNKTIEPITKTVNTDNTLSLVFDNNDLDFFFNSKIIYEYKKAFPTSETPYLQRVYKISMSGDNYHDDLLNLVDVEYVEKIEQGGLLLYEPNDYQFDGSPLSQLDIIRAPMAWEIATGNDSSVIGISDTSLNINHEDLINKIIEHTGSTSTNSGDHGTMVAGCAAGNTNNGLGISSIGYDTKLFTNSINFWTDNQMLLLSQKPNVKVINGSWYNTCTHSTISAAVYEEIWESGVLPIFAAGQNHTF